MGLDERKGKALAVEAKWTDLDHLGAKRLLSELAVKAHQVKGVRECVMGVMAKKIANKERIRNEGFMAFDLKDVEGMQPSRGRADRYR